MKKTLQVLMIGMLFLVSFVEVFAQDSYSIPVSCSIPSVPGVNAPPYPQDKDQLNNTNQNNQSAAVEETAIAKSELNGSLSMMTTIYPR